MDKKLNRQILFKPGKSVSDILEERANVQVENIDTRKKEEKPKIVLKKINPPPKPEKKELTLAERSKALYDWLDKHPLINLNGVCLRVGIDRANFVKGMGKGKELKKEILEKFIEELKEYGYAE